MIYSVANPIYDSVFKFLMEDERIAKTVLSALLKKEVVSVEMRRHEHPNVTRDDLSMFRIDFAAKVKEEDGFEHLILIELQKTWLETETLRFRRYLALQYNAEENMIKEGSNTGYAIPMVSVYLLGHRIGLIDKAVVYVGHKAVDYDGHVVEHGDTDPFINSLIHDSIIVQIPLLHGKINNKLDKVLSVFDQTKRDSSNQQIVCLEAVNYEDDSEMMYLLHRLGLAAMSAEVRQEMNDEDEYYSAIEARDTRVMQLNEVVSKQYAQINEQTAQINEQTAQINEQTAQINEQTAQINEQTAQINEQTAQINEQTAQINEQTAQINEQTAQIKAMAQAMLQNGVSIDVIAQTIHKSIEDVKRLLFDSTTK